MSSTVSRCIAVAAHGRRCQQSRYKGSPYCWHHLQSRKVFAPSRIVALRPRPLPVQAQPEPAADLAAARRENGDRDLADRLVRALGREAAAEIARLLERGADVTLTLMRHAGGVAVWQQGKPPRRAQASVGGRRSA
jgi:hypothetical protein